MRKIIALLLVFLMAMTMFGCKKKVTLHCDGCGKEVTTRTNMDDSWIVFCKDCEPSVGLD